MVRLDKCVEALYESVSIEDKQKTMNLLKVMKGAICVSKSKTGECIFRSNKVETVNLQRLVKCHKKNSMYEVSRIDTHKKMVVGRWSKLLENQGNCSAETLFGEILDIDTPDLSCDLEHSHVTPSLTRQMAQEKDHRLQRLIERRLCSYDTHPKIVIRKRRRHEFRSRPTTAGSEKEESSQVGNSDPHFVTEAPDVRSKLQNEADERHADLKKNMDGPKLQSAPVLRLPDIASHQGFKFKVPNSSQEKEKPDPDKIARDLTDWGNWDLKDKSWIKRYINKEKTRQEDLLLRNALNNIEKEMSGSNLIKRHQIRQKLQVEKEREAFERKKAEAMRRPFTSPETHVTTNIPNDIQLPVLSPTTNGPCHLPDITREPVAVKHSKKSPRMNFVKTKKTLRHKQNRLSRILNEIESNDNGLSVIIEHPTIVKKGKGPLTSTA